MNTASFSPARAGGRRFFALLALCCISFALAACMSSGPGDESVGSLGGSVKKLPYGISIEVPDGWVVTTSLAPDSSDKAALDARVRSGDRVLLIDFKRPSSSPQGMDARVGVFLLDSAANFLPREAAENLTDADFIKMGKDFLKREKELAAKNKVPSNTLDWKVSREAIDGRIAILQRGLGKGSEGRVRVLNWDIYLDGPTGVAIKMLGDPDVPGTETLLETIARSVRIDK